MRGREARRGRGARRRDGPRRRQLVVARAGAASGASEGTAAAGTNGSPRRTAAPRTYHRLRRGRIRRSTRRWPGALWIDDGERRFLQGSDRIGCSRHLVLRAGVRAFAWHGANRGDVEQFPPARGRQSGAHRCVADAGAFSRDGAPSQRYFAFEGHRGSGGLRGPRVGAPPSCPRPGHAGSGVEILRLRRRWGGRRGWRRRLARRGWVRRRRQPWRRGR